MTDVMNRAQAWLDEADKKGINLTDEYGYLAVIRDLVNEVKKRENDLMAAHNGLAQMMLRQSLATGHGDTIADLIRELEWQIEESSKRVGVFRLLVAACNRLDAEAEEYNFDDGMGRGAQLDYWYEFDWALERALEALK